MLDGSVLDRRAVTAIVAIGLVIGPGLILAAIVLLTHGFDPSATTPFAWFASALCLLTCFAVVRGVVRELRGAIGLRFDEQGVAHGNTRMAWSAITEIDSPEFGKLVLRDGSGTTLRIATYLLRDRDLVLREIGRRSGVFPRERMSSR